MIETGYGDCNVQTRVSGMLNVSTAAVGDDYWYDFVDQLADLTGSELKDALDTLDAKAAENPGDLNLRFQVAYAYAIYRDFLHGVGKGRYLYALGAHGELRGLYEGGRIMIHASGIKS